MNEVKAKIRLVFGINSFVVGGEKKFITYFKLLPKQKYDLHLITLTQHKENELYDLLPPDVTVHKFHFQGFKDIKSWLALYSCLKEIKPDVVVSGLFFSNTVFRVLKPLVRYRSIAMEQNTYVDKSRWQIMTDKILSHCSRKIIAVSNEVADFAAEQAGINRSKFVVINNGIDLERVQADFERLPSKEVAKQSLGYSPDDRLVINVARLVPQKNHQLLIQSFAEFSKAFPAYKLVIIGPGALKSELEKEAGELGASDKISLVGSVNDLAPYYRASDFFTSTSDIEGMSNAYLEALAYGLPLVATKTAGTTDLVEDGQNGLLINPDTYDIVEAMKVMASADLASMSQKALQTAKRFDVRQTVAEYDKVIMQAYV